MLRTRTLLLSFWVIISLVALQTNGSLKTEDEKELTYEEFIKMLQSDAKLANLFPTDSVLEPEVTNEPTLETEENSETIEEKNNSAIDTIIDWDQINKTEEADKNSEKNTVKIPREIDVLDYPLMLSIYMESFMACISDANSTDISSVVSVLTKN